MIDLTTDRWQLPDGVEELLPEAAWRVEHFRRRIMDCCHAWGFDLVMPPIIEYLDGLLTGTGETMELQTFKFVDQQNGRTLGVRADMTPQVARMDAHTLCRNCPNRLFYIGTVLRARTDGFGGSRSPQQFGAEIFGHAGYEADIEIIELMLETLRLAGCADQSLLLDIGHVGVYRHLVRRAGLNADEEWALFSALQRGSAPDVDVLLSKIDNNSTRARLGSLLQLKGDISVIDDARGLLDSAGAGVCEALDTLARVAGNLQRRYPALRLHVDLGELRGYRYHTGVLFAAYASTGEELARGGRYDDVGAAFGRARPATGFSGDLKQLADVNGEAVTDHTGIFVSAECVAAGGEAVNDRVAALRRSGERVVVELPGSATSAEEMGCDRRLVVGAGNLQVMPGAQGEVDG